MACLVDIWRWSWDYGWMQLLVRIARIGYCGLVCNSRVSIHLSYVSHPCMRLVIVTWSHIGSDMQRAGFTYIYIYIYIYVNVSIYSCSTCNACIALRCTLVSYSVCVNACNRRGETCQLASEWQDLKLERLSCVSIVACAYRTPPSGFALFS